MQNDIIVFDFDKTLTYKDTLLNFYIHTSKKKLKIPNKVVLLYFSNDFI